MMVSFLYPLCFLGAVAVAAPLWLHLRRRLERPAVRFAAMRFLDDYPIAEKQLSRLRDPWLFALRAAALALLVAAFTWPYLRYQSPRPIQVSRVLLLDNTLSHQADGRFLEAREAARQAVANASADSQVAVVEIGRTPRVLVDFLDRPAAAAAKLAALEPGLERGSYLAAFRQAAALLEMSSGPRRTIQLLSDNQENQWTEAEATLPFLGELAVELPELLPMAKANLSVASPEVRRSVQAGLPIVELQVQVARSGEVPAALLVVEANEQEILRRPVLFASPQSTTSTVRVAWPVNDSQEVRGAVRVRRLAAVPELPSPLPANTPSPATPSATAPSATASPTSPPAAADTAKAALPAAEPAAASSTKSAALPAASPAASPAAGPVELAVAIVAEDDALPMDDTVWFYEPPRQEGRVAVLARSPYLQAALSPEVMRGRWEAVLAPIGNRFLSSDVLVVEATQLAVSSHADVVDSFRKTGRGVLVVVDRVTAADQRPLQSLGLELGDEVKTDSPGSFRYLMFEHPMLQPFRARDFGDLLDLRVSRYQQVAASDARVLVFSAAGDPLLLEFDNGAGRMVVTAFGWDRQATNWAIHPSFVPFLDLCLEHLRQRDAWQRNFEPGERCLWRLAADTRRPADSLRPVAVVPPSSSAVVVTDADGGERYRGALRGVMADFVVPTRPGLYDVSLDGGQTVARTIAVNPSPLESQLAYASGDSRVASWRRVASGAAAAGSDAEKSGAARAAGESSPKATPVATGNAELVEPFELSAILSQTVWWWMLAGGALLFAIETMWASWRVSVVKSRGSRSGSTTPNQAGFSR